MGGGTRMTRMVTLLTAAIISILAHSGGANQLSYQHNKGDFLAKFNIWDRKTIGLAHCLTANSISSSGPDAAIFPPPRVTLSQAEACYYQPYHQHLACQCPERAPSEQAVDTDRVFLALHMEYWVNTMGQKVDSLSLIVLSCLLNPVSDIIPLSKGFIFFLFPSGKLEFSLKENWKPNWERVGTLLSPTLSCVLLA